MLASSVPERLVDRAVRKSCCPAALTRRLSVPDEVWVNLPSTIWASPAPGYEIFNTPEFVRSFWVKDAALIAGLRSCPSRTPVLLIRLIGLFRKRLVKNRNALGPAGIRP